MRGSMREVGSSNIVFRLADYKNLREYFFKELSCPRQ